MLKLKSVIIALICVLTVPVALAAKETRVAKLENFALRHGCNVTDPLPNSGQYLVWLEYLYAVYTGSAVNSEIFATCDNSPYDALLNMDATAKSEEGIKDGRERLMHLVDNSKMRIQQGYGAAEYVSYVYLTCPGGEECFSNSLKSDEYWAKICGGPDADSPNAFELDLFSNGNDMRFLLPYALTNCSLYEGNEGGRDKMVYNVLSRIFESYDGRGGIPMPDHNDENRVP